jgi:hypothetical protein
MINKLQKGKIKEPSIGQYSRNRSSSSNPSTKVSFGQNESFSQRCSFGLTSSRPYVMS